MLSFTSDLIKVFDQKQLTYDTNYSFTVVLNLRQCNFGEIPNTYGQFTECSICKPGTYSFDKYGCYECPNDATCEGGSKIYPNPGFWQKSNFSDLMIKCNSQEGNCLGGTAGN